MITSRCHRSSVNFDIKNNNLSEKIHAIISLLINYFDNEQILYKSHFIIAKTTNLQQHVIS